MLKQVLFPMLRAFVQVYNHHRFIDDDDVMHLPYTNSPEYPKQLPGNDTNYDIAYEMRACTDSLLTSHALTIHHSVCPSIGTASSVIAARKCYRILALRMLNSASAGFLNGVLRPC